MSKTQVDLASYVSKDGTYALNVDSKYPMENLNQPDARFQVRSDADEQLLLVFTFTEKVKICGFSITAPIGDMQPTKVKLFANQVSMGFDDAESTPAVFETDLETAQLSPEHTFPLRVVKFNGIDSVTVFIESSEGGDISAVSTIKFFGEPLQGTNMNELKKVG